MIKYSIAVSKPTELTGVRVKEMYIDFFYTSFLQKTKSKYKISCFVHKPRT